MIRTQAIVKHLCRRSIWKSSLEAATNCKSVHAQHSASIPPPNLTETATHFPPEFPLVTKGAFPTGLGNKGRVREGKAVYALALHSKAVAMTSIPAYNAAAATELSIGGATCLLSLDCMQCMLPFAVRLDTRALIRRGWVV